jgi:hypothetical protein
MEYMVLIYRDETEAPQFGSPEWEQMMAGFLTFNQRLIDGGHWIDGGGLQTTPSATTVRLSAGTVQKVLDGPYAETKEQLGGFYLVRAETLDEVLDLAKGLPIEGAIEIRPLTYRPSGEGDRS